MSKNDLCEYVIEGERIECTHCGHTAFHKGKAMLNTAGMTLLGLDWANQTAVTLMCDRCGLIHWFAKPPNAKKKVVWGSPHRKRYEKRHVRSPYFQ